MRPLEKIVLAGIALTLGAGLLVFAGCTGKNTPTPSPTPEPTQPPTVIPTPTPSPVPEPPPIVIEETLESKIYKNLLLNVPEIKEFDNEQQRRVIDQAVVQIRDDIYKQGLATDEKLAWEYISKGIKFVLPELKNADLNQYSDMDLRQILLPTTLRTIDIKSILEGNRDVRYNSQGLEQGLINVSPDDSLGGKSPQKVLRERVRDGYNDKSSKDYEIAMYWSTGAIAIVSWPNSTNSILKIREGMLARGEDAPLFVIGWPIYIVGEQDSSQFASLVGRSMEKPLAAYYSRANYPTGTAFHTETWVSYKGRLISAWMDEKAFLQDYERSTWPDFKGEISKPNLILLTPNGNYNPYTLKPINPK